jgi:hypothetical protein
LMEPGPHTGNCAGPKICMQAKNDSPRVVDTRVSAGPCLPANACQNSRCCRRPFSRQLCRRSFNFTFPLAISALRATSDIAVVSINQYATAYVGVIRRRKQASHPRRALSWITVRPSKEFANSLINCQDGSRTPRDGFSPHFSIPLMSSARAIASQATGQQRNEAEKARGRKEVERGAFSSSVRSHAAGVGCMTEPQLVLASRAAVDSNDGTPASSLKPASRWRAGSCKNGIEPMLDGSSAPEGIHAGGPGLGVLLLFGFRLFRSSSRTPPGLSKEGS